MKYFVVIHQILAEWQQLIQKVFIISMLTSGLCMNLNRKIRIIWGCWSSIIIQQKLFPPFTWLYIYVYSTYKLYKCLAWPEVWFTSWTKTPYPLYKLHWQKFLHQNTIRCVIIKHWRQRFLLSLGKSWRVLETLNLDSLCDLLAH